MALRIVVKSVPTKSVPEAHSMTVWQNAKESTRSGNGSGMFEQPFDL